METIDLKGAVSRSQRLRGLFLILAIGVGLCVWQLGSTGLIDETPPLFAAAGRGMSDSGDWLTPRVNGLTRFDKPPLVYWLMALGYSLPYQELWDPLGTWSARLPSALSTVLMMLVLGDTLMKFVQKDDVFPRRTAVLTALAFALSPLVMIWSRIAVSDALLCSTLGVSMLLLWQQYASPGSQHWYLGWCFLGLAVLTKGPVAIVLLGSAFAVFGLLDGKLGLLFKRLRSFQGLLITALISLPWYLMEFFVEGEAFWDSFFGYHNFQRFTSVVNGHQEPWWFFGPVLVVASLPFTPLLILGLFEEALALFRKVRTIRNEPEDSLQLFAFSWLITVFFLFTFAATKLPSYWLPATPAAALLIGLGANAFRRKGFLLVWWLSIITAFIISLVLWSSPTWILSIKDPEMPSLGTELLKSGIGVRGAICLSMVSIMGVWMAFKPQKGMLLGMQGPLIFFQLFVLLPIWNLGDELRQLPLRQSAQLLVSEKKPNEPFAMVGAAKPSVHFYSGEVVIYEGRSLRALVDLKERLYEERRKDWSGRPIDGPEGSSTVLVVIDGKTALRPHWAGLKGELLGQFGIYLVWRVDRKMLESQAKAISDTGILSDWRIPQPERF